MSMKEIFSKSNLEHSLNDYDKFLDRMIEAKATAMVAEAAFIVYLNEQEQKKCGRNLKTK